jgi:CRISPR-associated protein Cmr6
MMDNKDWLAGESSAVLPAEWVGATAVVDLVTPAFLGSQAADCDLSAEVLRDPLRHWWRILHAGCLPGSELDALETMLWGNAAGGGALRLSVTAEPTNPATENFDYRDRLVVRPDFRAAHDLAPVPERMQQGLFYLAHGLDAPPRIYRPAGCRWTVRLAVGPEIQKPLSSADVLDQARAALWLLGQFGGIGAKAECGFGSVAVTFHDWREPTVAVCRDLVHSAFDPAQTDAPALNDPRFDQAELPTRWSDPWHVLDQVGFAYQAFVRRVRHDHATWKPPRPTPPIPGRRPPPEPVPPPRPPDWLDFPLRNDRVRYGRPAPVYLHIGRGSDRLIVRAAVLPAGRYQRDDAAVIGQFLQQFRREMSIRTQGRVARRASEGGSVPSPPSSGERGEGEGKSP